jgi:hypothetical protein
VAERFYCADCGEIQPVGEGFINCRHCGRLGLRGFNRRPIRVSCPQEGCHWTGWDDGGVNDELPGHLRREHQALPDGDGCLTPTGSPDVGSTT